MDPSYSAFADWLSKVHTAPPLIQALWILAGPAALVGIAACAAWAAREIAALRGRAYRAAAELEGFPLYAIYRTPEGRWMLLTRGKVREMEEGDPPDTLPVPTPPSIPSGRPCPARIPVASRSLIR